MYKIAVSGLVNGGIAHQKLQISGNSLYYSAAHLHLVSVMLRNISSPFLYWLF